jgi:hypothetical protein
MSKRPTLSLTIALALLFCCGANTTTCNPPPPTNTGPNVAAIAVGVVAGAAATAVILVSVNHAHHNLKGCVFSTPNGLQLRTEDLKDYTLTGSTTNLAVGNSVRLHGDRQKHDKTAPGEQIFLVKELKKNYGPCTVLAASIPSPGVPVTSPPSSSTSAQAHP